MTKFIGIIRPANCLFAAFTTLVGFYYLIPDMPVLTHFTALFAGLSTLLVAAGGYVINDFFDYEIDKVNQPQRPLPAGELSLHQARWYSFCLFGAGWIVALFTQNIYCIVIALFNSLSLVLYARTLKKTLLLGNLIVAWNTCSTFIYGAILTQNLRNILPLAVFAFLYTIIREWVKCVEDYDGDRENGVHSIAVVCGQRGAVAMCYIPALALMFSLPAFFLWQYLPLDLYFLLTLFITLPVMVFLFALNRVFRGSKTSGSNHNFPVDFEGFKASVAKVQKSMKLNMLSIVLIYVVKDLIYRFYV